jgi:hypothetical protein
VVVEGAEVTEKQAETFGKELSNLIVQRLKDQHTGERRKFTLRMSNIGKGARQLWYEKHFEPEEKFEGPTLIKFIIGDIAEHLILFLADVAGHSVTALQDEVDIDGIKGHIDADIDGVTVDVKSASPFQFKKFKYGTIKEDDAFGYIDQLGGYCKARGTSGAFLALEKVSGHLAYLPLTEQELGVDSVGERIEYLKKAVEQDEPPERCYPDQEEGASGNRVLGVNCSYCAFKRRCWSNSNGGLGLRTFLYSNGPKFFTEVKREPKVHEVSF